MEKKTLDIKLTSNFKLSEFIRSTTANKYSIYKQFQPPFVVVSNLLDLSVNVLQPLRNKIGRIDITSGYRSAEVNKIVGGAINSQHLHGAAADFRVRNMEKAIEELKALCFDQLIIYPRFFHVSYVGNRNRNQIIDKRR